MSTRTRAGRAQRCERTAAVAGWVALAGTACFIAGLVAEFGILGDQFGVLAPLGVIPLLIGGIVSMGADQLADRYREPVNEDADQ